MKKRAEVHETEIKDIGSEKIIMEILFLIKILKILIAKL